MEWCFNPFDAAPTKWLHASRNPIISATPRSMDALRHLMPSIHEAGFKHFYIPPIFARFCNQSPLAASNQVNDVCAALALLLNFHNCVL
jgi:hypothetical protein